LVSCYIISWSCIICVVCYMFDLSVTFLKLLRDGKVVIELHNWVIPPGWYVKPISVVTKMGTWPHLSHLNRHPPELHANDLRSTYGNRCNHYMLCISVLLCRGASGDLYIFVRINEKQGIHRDGLNLYSDVSYTDAILGTTVKVSS